MIGEVRLAQQAAAIFPSLAVIARGQKEIDRAQLRGNRRAPARRRGLRPAIKTPGPVGPCGIAFFPAFHQVGRLYPTLPPSSPLICLYPYNPANPSHRDSVSQKNADASPLGLLSLDFSRSDGASSSSGSIGGAGRE